MFHVRQSILVNAEGSYLDGRFRQYCRTVLSCETGGVEYLGRERTSSTASISLKATYCCTNFSYRFQVARTDFKVWTRHLLLWWLEKLCGIWCKGLHLVTLETQKCLYFDVNKSDGHVTVVFVLIYHPYRNLFAAHTEPLVSLWPVHASFSVKYKSRCYVLLSEEIWRLILITLVRIVLLDNRSNVNIRIVAVFHIYSRGCVTLSSYSPDFDYLYNPIF